jgi:hypothetical protein
VPLLATSTPEVTLDVNRPQVVPAPAAQRKWKMCSSGRRCDEADDCAPVGNDPQPGRKWSPQPGDRQLQVPDRELSRPFRPEDRRPSAGDDPQLCRQRPNQFETKLPEMLAEDLGGSPPALDLPVLSTPRFDPRFAGIAGDDSRDRAMWRQLVVRFWALIEDAVRQPGYERYLKIIGLVLLALTIYMIVTLL